MTFTVVADISSLYLPLFAPIDSLFRKLIGYMDFMVNLDLDVMLYQLLYVIFSSSHFSFYYITLFAFLFHVYVIFSFIHISCPPHMPTYTHPHSM